MRYYIFCIMGLDDGIPEKEVVHTHEETGVTHAHEGGNKPHDHNEAEYEIAEKTGCICVDSRLLDCPEHGNKN